MPDYQDIWLGDSSVLSERLKWVDCIITDPPFGVDNQSNQAVTPEGKAHATKILNDETPEQAIAVFKEVMDVLLTKTVANCDMYIFTSYQVLTDWLVMTDEYLAPFGFKRKAILLWEKDGPGMGDTNFPFGMGCEFILAFQKGRRAKTGKRRGNVLRVPQVRPEDLIHPHEKPEGLFQLLMEQSTSRGDFIVDPFGGSGVAARAARLCGRNCVSMELDPARYEVSKKKFDQQSGGLDFS